MAATSAARYCRTSEGNCSCSLPVAWSCSGDPPNAVCTETRRRTDCPKRAANWIRLSNQYLTPKPISSYGAASTPSGRIAWAATLGMTSPRAHLHVVGIMWFMLWTTELVLSFLFCSCDYFCLSGPFSCISVHKFSRQLSVFSLSYFCLTGPFN